MTFEQIVKDINSKKYKSIYFLCGEESFFIDRITDMIESQVLSEDEKAFNLSILYGNEHNMVTVTDTARRFPMMSEKQVVIVKEAQNIKDYDNLTPYVEHIQPSTILLFAYKGKKADKRKNVFKKLGTSPDCVYFESNKMYDNKIPDWIIEYCKSKKYAITPKAAVLLSEYMGNNLNGIANEIDKLLLLLPVGQEIKESLIEEHTGISKDFNVFELQSAIIRKDFLKTARIMNYFEANPKNNPLVLTVATLFKYFLNLLTFHYQKKVTPNTQEIARSLGINPFFLKDYVEGANNYGAGKCAQIISILREYDLKSKGVGNAGIPDAELLKEMLFKIMH